jgi:hypothetical protein
MFSEFANQVHVCNAQKGVTFETEEIPRPVSTLESNRDRDVSTRRDVLYQTVKIFSTVEMSFLKCRDREQANRDPQA